LTPTNQQSGDILEGKTVMSSFARHRIGASRVLVALLLVMIAITGSHWHHSNPVFGDSLVALGLMLATIGGIGRLWCNLYIVGYKNASLLTIGPYSMTRNPLYFFSSIGGVGVGLTTGTLGFALAIAGLFALTYPSVILSEEARQRSLHGKAWEDYVAAVPRFFPRFSQLNEPADYTAHPLLFRRHLLDAVWFPWAGAVLIILGELREIGLMPTVFTLF
jgi:protein-S-isoprenylcysteine O-methyltransferase Ste14